MAISKAPSGEIRAPVIHGYPVPLSFCEAVAIKAFGHERLDVTLGRRGKQVKRSVSCPWPVPMSWPTRVGQHQYHPVGDLAAPAQPVAPAAGPLGSGFHRLSLGRQSLGLLKTQ